jgi:hypothetical protein
MSMFGAHRRKLAAIAGLLAWMALAMRVLVPAGFMPAATPLGPQIVICTGAGPISVADPAGAAESPGDETPKKVDHPCAPAGFAAEAMPETFAFASRSVEVSSAAAPPARPDLVPGRGLAAPPPPATGPPSLT